MTRDATQETLDRGDSSDLNFQREAIKALARARRASAIPAKTYHVQEAQVWATLEAARMTGYTVTN